MRDGRLDRAVTAAVLGALTLLAWADMVSAANQSAAGRLLPCCGSRFGVAFAMWVVMMAGMMIPSVAPTALAYAGIVRRRGGRGAAMASSGLFVAGYLLAWTGFSAAAAFAQWALYHGAMLDGHTLAIGPWAGGGVLLAAAGFQLSPAKHACLAHCRAPLGFFMIEWRDGPGGAVNMGVRHGVQCVACCWLLMAVLFAVGIMNVLWGAAITAFVLAEKVLPWRRPVVLAGSGACLAGAALLLYRAATAS